MKQIDLFFNSPRKVLTLSFLIGVFCMILFYCSDPVFYRDSAWYAAQVRAFQAGYWTLAFPDWLPLLTAALGGVISLAGVDAMRALTLASGILMALTVFPVYGFCSFLMEKKYAAWCSLLAALMPHLIKSGFAPLTDSARWLFMSMALWLIFDWTRSRRVWKLLLLGVVYGLLSLSRSEGIVFAAMFCAVHWLYASVKTAENKKEFFCNLLWAALPLTTAFLTVLPRLIQMYSMYGYFVIDTRQLNACASAIAMLTGNPHGKELLSGGASLTVEGMGNAHALRRTFRNFFDGFYIVYGIFAVIGILSAAIRKQWKSEHTVLALIPGVNLILHLLMQASAGRYFYVNGLFWIPFTLTGLRECYLLAEKLILRFAGNVHSVFRILVTAGLACTGFFLLRNGLSNMNSQTGNGMKFAAIRKGGELWRSSCKTTPSVLIIGEDRGWGCFWKCNLICPDKKKEHATIAGLISDGYPVKKLYHWETDLRNREKIFPDVIAVLSTLDEDFEPASAKIAALPGVELYPLPEQYSCYIRIYTLQKGK